MHMMKHCTRTTLGQPHLQCCLQITVKRDDTKFQSVQNKSNSDLLPPTIHGISDSKVPRQSRYKMYIAIH